jgi:hypothetical protein
VDPTCLDGVSTGGVRSAPAGGGSERLALLPRAGSGTFFASGEGCGGAAGSGATAAGPEAGGAGGVAASGSGAAAGTGAGATAPDGAGDSAGTAVAEDGGLSGGRWSCDRNNVAVARGIDGIHA